MNKYLCNDGNAEIEITAKSTRAAAREYVDGGDWNDVDQTQYIDVYVQEIDEDGYEVGERECIATALEPAEPDCDGADGHDWQSPHSVLGGLAENPGVQGHGGGVIIRQVCAHCGIYRVIDTWANNGAVQGFSSNEYEDADEASLTWIEPTDD